MKRLAELRADFRPAVLTRAVLAGWLVGAVLVVHCIAVSAIVFNGPLLPHVGQGTGMIIFSAIAISLVAGLSSSFRGMVGAPQEVPAAVLGALAASVATGTLGAPAEVPFMVMTLMLVGSGLLTGLILLGIGVFKVSRFFRIVPYSVLGGFFAGSGWVLVVAALSVMSSVTVDWHTLPRMVEPELVWKWAPGVAYGLILAFIMRRKNGLTAMTVSLVIAVVLYHAILLVLGISVEEAAERGLMMSVGSQQALWSVVDLNPLAHVSSALALDMALNLVAVIVVMLVHVVVCITGIEIATGVETDLDQEFRTAGIACLGAGAFASVPGCQTFAFTLTARMLGADTPWTSVVVACVFALTLMLGDGLLALLPMSIIGAVPFVIGLELLNTWAIRGYKRFHWPDFVLVLLIGATIAWVGFVEGIGLGMLATLVLFTYRLAWQDVIRESFTAAERGSGTIRSIPDQAILRCRGDRIRVFRIGGYVFFGNAHRLGTRLRQAFDTVPAPESILIDFAAVSDCDTSGVTALCDFIRKADSRATRVAISACPVRIKRRLQSELSAELRQACDFHRDLGHALGRCEDTIVAAAAMELVRPDGSVAP